MNRTAANACKPRNYRVFCVLPTSRNVKRTLFCQAVPIERCMANCTTLLVLVIGTAVIGFGERQKRNKQCVERRGD
jgi:hypothetical protein